MALNNSAPKQWSLTESESLSSFESWRSNLIYRLNLEARFSIFLLDGVEWNKKSRIQGDTRGLQPDLLAADAHNHRAPNPDGYTAAQKVQNLELMLQQVANFCPIISRRTIINESASMASVWQAIKLHFGFQTTGANFIDFIEIKFTPPERPETLYQRLLTFIENNLLTPELEMTYKGEDIEEIEDMSPTLENLVVLLWLQQIHHNLPNIVKQKYGADLRSQTLASLKPEISLALPSLIEEAKTADARVMRSGQQSSFPRQAQASPFPRSVQSSSFSRRSQPSQPNRRDRPRVSSRQCPLCKASRRDANHFLSACKFLPEADKRFMSRARQVIVEDEEASDFEEFLDNEQLDDTVAQDDTYPTSRVARVNVRASPLFHTFYQHNPLTITIDTGAETNLIRAATASAIGCPVLPSCQVAFQADGKTPLSVKGETHVTLTRDELEFSFSGLIVDDLDVDILAGVPFMEDNDISVRPKSKVISVGDSHHFTYRGSVPSYSTNSRSTILRTTAKTTVWPGDFLDVSISTKDSCPADSLVAVEPHMSSVESDWPSPGIYQAVGSHIRIFNSTDQPQVFKKHAHVALVSPVFEPPETLPSALCQANLPCLYAPVIHSSSSHKPTSSRVPNHSTNITLNPDNVLSEADSAKFSALHQQFESVFDPEFGTYNHKFGSFEAVVNMGSVKPPQRKGRIPQYSRDKLVELQHRFDELDSIGVLAKPESIGITVEYLNPSFLVKKPQSDNEFRFVTAFTEVGKYCKPQPSLMPNVDSTIRSIARWKYIIKTDLTSAFYQIPLSKDSMKYCGVASPFKGIRVYTRCAMGMPGSETALEELMCRLLGDFVEAGGVTKIADDLYCGGETIEDLLSVWESVLCRLSDANLKLSAKKTVIAPAKTIILGWVWHNGVLSADPHKLSALSTCTRPVTTKGLRSFIGAYKVLARVLPRCAAFLQPLDRATHGKKSADKVEWDDTTTVAFERAQSHLSSNKDIVLPREGDQLWVITDGASSTSGMGATLYALRDNKLHLAGFFSQQLSPTHLKWFPCEIEGITIAAAVKYFDGFIIQSSHRTQVLTDCKSCVDAYNRLLRGQFSSNVRLSTFLSAASRHHVIIRHIAGAANLPSDFASRNPVVCTEFRCQVCVFANSLDDSVVRAVSVSDVLNGRGQLPFTSRKAWLATQAECRDLRRTKAHLIQGTRPTKKETTIRSIKRYLNKVGLASDGLLIVQQCDALAPSREAIVVPEEVLPGLLIALHLRLNHPSQSELSRIVKRYFWAIKLDSALEQVSEKCYTCASLRKVPKSLIPESTSDPPESVGCNFAADVMCRERQKILVIREYVSSLTRTAILASEKQDDLRVAIVSLIHDITPIEGPPTIVRTDNAPGFQALVNDKFLTDNRINIDLGRVKNKNRNPVAEKAIQELENEIVRVVKVPGPISPLVLSMVTSSLNSRIRTDGLSAREIFFQRDQFTNNQIPLSDRALIMAKHNRSVNNHRYSELCKAGGAPALPESPVEVGDLVYLYSDRDKHVPRSRYLVTMLDDKWCHLRKFIGDTLRANSYKVKRAEVYKVPSDPLLDAMSPHTPDSDTDCDLDEDTARSTCLPSPEVIPLQSNQALPANLPVPSEINMPVVQSTTQSSYPPPSQAIQPPSPPTPRPVLPPPTRKSTRLRKPPGHLRDYACPLLGQPLAQPTIPAEISMPVAQTTSTAQTEVPLRRSSRVSRPPQYLDDYTC